MTAETVWKFVIPMGGAALVAMPAGAQIISVQIQTELPIGVRQPKPQLCCWAIVDPDLPVMVRNLIVVGTGFDLPRNATAKSHIATVQDGVFVWHIFDGGWQ